MGETNHPVNQPRRRRPNSGSSLNSLDAAYYHDLELQDSNTLTPNVVSSPEHVFKVIRHFDERKKEIVRSIGFSGILQLSRFSELDPNFSLWLYRKVHWSTCSLHPAGKIKIVMRAEHVGKIIGIPYSGIEVKEKAFENDDQKIAFMKQSLSFLGNESQILDSAEQYLHQDVPFLISKAEANKFRVAFVIFVMGRFLAPSLDATKPRSDFWGALKNPEAIHSFNWSSFVLSHILEASRSVVWNVLRNVKVSFILGCPLILQILYLDIMDIGDLKLPHDVVPRVKHFNSALLAKMIEAERVDEDSPMSELSFGRAKDIRRDNTCYTFSDNVSSIKAQPKTAVLNEAPCPPVVQIKSNEEQSCFDSRGKHAITPNQHSKIRSDLLHRNQAPISDAPDFSATLRDYFQGQVDPLLLECFRFHQAMCLQHFTKFTSGLKAAITKENITLVSKVVNHQRRCSGLPPINLELSRPSVTRRNYDDMLSGAESGDDSTPRPIQKKHHSIVGGFETPGLKREHQLQRSETSSKTEHVSSFSILSPNPIATLNSPNPAHHNNERVNYTTPETNTRNLTRKFQLPIVSPTSENRTFLGANLGARISSVAQEEELNERSHESVFPDSSIPKKHVQPGRLAVTHWVRNVDHPVRDFSLTRSFFDWLRSTTSAELEKPWIMHDYPRFIQLSGRQLRDYFTDIHPMNFDAFDLCIRRIKQLDNALCPRDIHLTWRHLLESDYSMHVLGGETPANYASIRQQFVSTLIDYHLERCRMFYVPVFFDGLWWCYAWDLKSFTLTINDPSVGQESDSLVIQKHAGTIELLNKFLYETILQFYTGWHPNFQGCNIVVFRTADMPIERSKSAFFTLFFIKNFNGVNLVTASSPNALQRFKEYMLYELLELKDNRVNPPSTYIHSVDD